MEPTPPKTPALRFPPLPGLRWLSEQTWSAYCFSGTVLLLVLLAGEKFWMTNDDIEMSMTVGGYGIAAAPYPGLLGTNSFAWSWLLERVPDLGGLRGYSVATYTLLLASCGIVAYALWRRRAPAWFAAAALLVLYGGALLLPQFTVVAGYVAMAGMALLLLSGLEHRRSYLLLASLLLTLAGLIRLSELLLVLLVAAPYLFGAWLAEDGLGRRLNWVVLAAAGALLLAGSSALDNHMLASAPWQQFNDVDDLRAQFTDFNLAAYFLAHRPALAGSGLTPNDMNLMRKFFYLDPAVFNSAHLAPLVDAVSAWERLLLNKARFRDIDKVFLDPWLPAVLAVLALTLAAARRVTLAQATSIALFLLFMVGISLWGRPGVLRVYLPAAGTLLLTALYRPAAGGGRAAAALGLVAMLLATVLVGLQFSVNAAAAQRAEGVRSFTCAKLPHDELLVVWTAGNDFGWRDLYRPTTRADDACDPPLYSIGDFDLAPQSLDQLHRYTGGKGFIEALLAGQPFYLATKPDNLPVLDQYLHEHYQAGLTWQAVVESRQLMLFHIAATPPRAAPGAAP